MKINILALSILTSLLVSACGGSGGSPDPAVNADTNELKNNAVAAIGGSFDDNLTAVGALLNRNRDGVVGTVGDVLVGGTDEFPQDIQTDVNIQSDLQSLVLTSLAAGEGSQGVTTRLGNTIRIDPDDGELCEDESFFGTQDENDLANCRALVSDLLVELVASGEESGEVNYLFQERSMLKLGYAPGSESVELDLTGLSAFAMAYNGLNSGGFVEPANTPEIITGSFRLATTTSNSALGQEAGSVSVDIVNPINIVVNDNIGQQSVTMNPGTLFEIAADAATGQGSLSFDVGSIASVFRDGSRLARLNLAGFTGNADVNPDNGMLVVSNLGLSRGPLSVSINNQDVLKLTLESFGFQVSEQSEQLTIDGDLNLSLLLDGLGLENTGLSNLMLNVMAPSGTGFTRAGNGALEIGGTGPFSVSLGETSILGVLTESLATVNAGECVLELTPDAEDQPSAQKCF